MSITAEIKKFALKALSGMNMKVEPLDLKDRWVENALNVRYEDLPGSVVKRDPVTYFNSTSIGDGATTGLYRYYTSTGIAVWIATNGTTASVGTDIGGTFTTIRSNLTSSKRHTFETYQDLLIASNGFDNPWVYDGDGVTWELGACRAEATTAAGSLSAGSYYYSVTIGGSDEYVCGAVSNTVTASASGTIELSHIPLGPLGTTARKVYRTAANGSALLLVATIGNNTATTYTDIIADASLGAAYPSVNDDMPKGAEIRIHRERAFITRDPSSPNKIYYSLAYLPHYIQQTTQLSYMQISAEDGDEISGIPIQLGVMVCIKKNSIRKLHITSPVSGADPTTWYADDPIAWIGSPSPWSITQTPSGIVFLGWDHWYIFDGASAQPIFDEFDTAQILDANFNDVVGYYHKGVMLAAYTDNDSAAQTHNRIMRYNFKRQALGIDSWTSAVLTGANCFAARTGDSEPGDLYYGDSAFGYVVKDKDSENNYRLRSKSEVITGDETNIFNGGTENAPYIEIGAAVAAEAIPTDICILWDKELTTPGSGWTEITVYAGDAIKISGTSLTTDNGTPHTHLLTGSIPLWSGQIVNYGNDNPGCVSAHSHEVSYASDAATPLPRHVKFRIFKKNATTTEYEFPDGAIIMYDQAAAPEGWQMLSSYGFGGYYAVLGTTGLATINPSIHTHTFNIPTGTAAGILKESDQVFPGDPAYPGSGPAFGHNHVIVGELSTVNQDTENASPWELANVSFNFIKKIGESSSWDGVARYAYALYANSTTPGLGWTEDTTYEGKFLKIGSTAPVVGAGGNASHTHVAGTFTTSTESARWGSSGYLAQGYAAPHTHQVVLNGAAGSSGNPPSVTFRLMKKVLGQMKAYNDAGSVVYTTGTWVAPSAKINAESLGKLYWNEVLVSGDDVLFYTRTGSTQALCEAATWDGPLTDPNGSDISSAADIWFQYKIELSAVTTVTSNPRVYFTNGYMVRYTYHIGATDAETSVNFQYKIGFRNFDEPGIDKIYKKIVSKHEGTLGSFTLAWETENSSDEFVVPLSTFPDYWDSFFQDTAFGKEISIEVNKNDLFAFRLSELEGLYSPAQLII